MRVLNPAAFMFLVTIAVGSAVARADTAMAEGEPSKAQLAEWLRQYPEADANGDGVLTIAEADAYRKKREQQRRQRQGRFQQEFTFATMSDGVRIALAIAYPAGFDPRDTDRKWPAMLNMNGYPGATVPQSPNDFGNHYVTVRASLRGSGASGGTIHAISRRNGMDGYEIIENWIVKQPWSNGKVALHGHSWGGLTGFMIAATNPPHLKAAAVSGLFDNIYRDIGRIGGIRNSGFPVDWMVNLYKPTGSFDSGTAAMQARGLSRDEYREIVRSRPPWDIAGGILWKSLSAAEDAAEFQAASPGTFAGDLRVPIHIMHAYQDEQTGPSGVWLWKYVPDDTPKRLVLSNGDHGVVGYFGSDRRRWLDFWTLGDDKDDSSDLADRERRVQVYFETPRASRTPREPIAASDFPLPRTRWTRYYFRQAEQLGLDPPRNGKQSGDSYQVDASRDDADLDAVLYKFRFDQPTAMCGPIAVSLWATCSTLDTDFFVVVADIDPRGTVQYLQRGLLRASHRTLDREKSYSIVQQGKETLVRPRHTHKAPQPLLPNQPYRFDIEVFPVGHLFRSGHHLAVQISQPPKGDPVTRHRDGDPAYEYTSDPPPGVVTVLRDAEHPSSVLLPILPELPPMADKPPPAGEQNGIFVK
jgi:predicted acyl esterase